MQQTLEQHILSRFTISDIRPKLKFDSREPDVMAEVTFYLNKYNKALITLLSMSILQKQANCIAENTDFIETLSEDDPVTLEDMADLERSKYQYIDDDLDDADFYIDYEED
jgi:hypothetical protein